MPIPPEFADYLSTTEVLTRKEQEERLTRMYTDEIVARAKTMRELNYDKATATRRIRKNYEWAFEFGDRPSCIGELDSLVDAVYNKYPSQF